MTREIEGGTDGIDLPGSPGSVFRRISSLSRKTELGKELFNAFRKLDLLQEFLEDEGIPEIMINGTKSIFFERDGRIYKSDKRFLSKEKLEDVIQQIVAGLTVW